MILRHAEQGSVRGFISVIEQNGKSKIGMYTNLTNKKKFNIISKIILFSIIYKLFMHNNYENVKPSFEKNTIFFFSKTFLVIHYY